MTAGRGRESAKTDANQSLAAAFPYIPGPASARRSVVFSGRNPYDRLA